MINDIKNAMSTPNTQTLAAGRAYRVSITAHEIHNGNDIIGLAENEADAQRFAACWNACQGVPTEALRPQILADANSLAAGRLEQMESDRKQALAWRDALNKFSKIMREAEDWPDTNAERVALEELVKKVRQLPGLF